MTTNTIASLQRRIKRLTEQTTMYKVPNPAKTFNFHGGWNLGYLEGKITTLKEQLFELQVLKK